MAKRFTDTEKWGDPWFRNLLPEYQRFWIYLLDRCDTAGVWEVDFEVVEFFLKQKYSEKEIINLLKGRIVIFDNQKKWFIPKFISFQYGRLDPFCNPHKSIFKLLSSYKLEGYLEGINTSNTRQDKTIQDKDKTRTVGHFENCKCPKCRKLVAA